MKYYTKEHQWVKLDGDDAIVGITGFAARELGDISYVELPREGSDVIVGDSLGIVESVTDSSNVYSPVSGTVILINHNLDDDPGIINRSPEEKGWICKLENIDLAEFDDLLEEEDYKKISEHTLILFHSFRHASAEPVMRQQSPFAGLCLFF